MKMVMCIVDDMDAYSVVDRLTRQKIQVTKLNSTGGFLKKGNTTLLIGLEDDQVQWVVDVVKSLCNPKDEVISMETLTMLGYGDKNPFAFNVKTGGAVIFVMNVENFVKV